MYRNGVSIYNGPNTINQFTDNTQLNINTVYEYSVVAISCAGTSTAGVKSIRIESEITNVYITPLYNIYYCLSSTVTSLSTTPPLSLSFNSSDTLLSIDWVSLIYLSYCSINISILILRPSLHHNLLLSHTNLS